MDKNVVGEATCRACFWRTWAAEVRRVQAGYVQVETTPLGDAQQKAEVCGYDYLEPLTTPSLTHDPHRVRCRYCGRISAERMGDIGWGCQCQVNPRRDGLAKKEGGLGKKRDLFKDSTLDSVQWWDHEKNSTEAWETLTVRARTAAHWRCPQCNTGFAAAVEDMVPAPQCPRCTALERQEREKLLERLGNTVVSDIPELLAAWDDDADPSSVTVAGSWISRRFVCPKGHRPRMSPSTFLLSGCPHCRGAATLEERLAEIEVDPHAFAMNHEILAQWHPTANGKLDPRKLSPNSRRMAWWREASCGHEWQDTPSGREKRQRLRCPECRTILDSLAYHFPKLGRQWSTQNPLTAWQVRPAATLAFVPEWVCPDDSTHSWTASLATRTGGAGCPMCREAGKSAIELAYFEAARRRFGNAASGTPWRSSTFTRRSVWHPDISVDLDSDCKLVIEYDGAFWHVDKTEIDAAKTRDLLAAGALVVRLREHPLPRLDVIDTHYLEITVYSSAPDLERNLDRITRWVNA